MISIPKKCDINKDLQNVVYQSPLWTTIGSNSINLLDFNTRHKIRFNFISITIFNIGVHLDTQINTRQGVIFRKETLDLRNSLLK